MKWILVALLIGVTSIFMMVERKPTRLIDYLARECDEDCGPVKVMKLDFKDRE